MLVHIVQSHSYKAGIGRKAWDVFAGRVSNWWKVGLIFIYYGWWNVFGSMHDTVVVWHSGLCCSYVDIDQMIDSMQDIEVFLPSQLSSHTSDASMFLSSSESSYNSDQGSGNEDGHDASYVIYDESSDEVDFLML
jgi:hypothetical protein